MKSKIASSKDDNKGGSLHKALFLSDIDKIAVVSERSDTIQFINPKVAFLFLKTNCSLATVLARTWTVGRMQQNFRILKLNGYYQKKDLRKRKRFSLIGRNQFGKHTGMQNYLEYGIKN